MQQTIIYYTILMLELIIAAGMCFYAVSMLYSFIMGAPYVATTKKQLLAILKTVQLKPGQLFVELGCGDGRVVRTAVKQYHVHGLGIEVNPSLTWWARFFAKRERLNHIEFRIANVLHVDLTDADVVYMFFLPEFITKLEAQLTGLKKGTVVISHGFKVPYFNSKLSYTLEMKPYNAYFYKV